MAGDSNTELSFAVLDALLDRALELDDAARDAFLASLPEIQREALHNLLRRSATDALSQFSVEAQQALRELDDTGGDGAKAGEWQLQKEIGAGGTGQVFYAERRETREDAGSDSRDTFVQRAAVKVLWSHRVRSQFRDRFLRERRILASIDHPGLARFLDGGLLGDGRPWFAMEFVDGDDIVEFTRSKSINERLRLFVDIANTINFAHQRLIVHRDIKPQNILVDAFATPRVLDFGIAGMLGEIDQQALTHAQGTPLTLQYASPEQVSGASVDVASDVYQLGLLLYEMLTDRQPYSVEGESLRAAVRIIREQVPAPPSAHNAKLDRDIDAIVSKALRKEAAERYSSAAAMSDDVGRFLQGRPIAARPQSQWYILSRFLRRNALVATVVAGSVVALSLATAFSINRAAQAQAQAERSRVTQQILADVFEQADPFGAGGAELTLAEALVRAKPSIEQKVQDDPQLAWEVNKTLVGIFTNLDLLDLEEEALRSAWDAALELDGDNEKERLFAIAGLGNIKVRVDPSDGLAFLEEHLPIAPTTKRGASEWLSAKYAEVSAHLRLRQNAEADQGARTMARVAQEFGVDSPRTLGRIQQLLAGGARRVNDLDAADQHWASAVDHMRRAEAPLSLAITLSNYALHYGMTGRYEESVFAFEESIEIFRIHASDNTSHANVLRLYAGLLFRMRDTDAAMGALDEALAILDPSEQSYAYFLAQLNRAGIAFASGDTSTALVAIEQGLNVALPVFGNEAEVTQRIVPVFTRLLLFAEQVPAAARLIAIKDRSICEDRAALVAAIETAAADLANTPDTLSARRDFLQQVTALERTAATGSLEPAAIGAAMTSYANPADVFVDVLDRYRYVAALSELVIAHDLDADLAVNAELERLKALQAKTAAAIDANPRVTGLIDSLSRGFIEVCSSF